MNLILMILKCSLYLLYKYLFLHFEENTCEHRYRLDIHVILLNFNDPTKILGILPTLQLYKETVQVEEKRKWKR